MKYDGEKVMMLDGFGKVIEEYEITIFIGQADVVSSSEGIGMKALKDENDRHIVINPKKNLDRMMPSRSYAWYAQKYCVDKHSFAMNTSWKPIFLREIIAESLKRSDQNELCIVESMKIEGFMDLRFKYLIVPLLETISHIRQEFIDMSLKQIAYAVNRNHNPRFNDKLFLMDFLFKHFENEFKLYCERE